MVPLLTKVPGDLPLLRISKWPPLAAALIVPVLTTDEPVE